MKEELKKFFVRNGLGIFLLLLSLGYIFPINPAWRAIIFIYSLDLFTLPLPFGKIIVKILLLLFVLPFLATLPLFSLIKFDLGLAYVLIIALLIGEILSLIFGGFFVGKFAPAIVKAVIVFIAGLFALNFKIEMSFVFAIGILFLNLT